MADNVSITPGIGATVAADDIGGVLFQRIKPTFGTDGNATDVSASNPMPVVQTGTLNVQENGSALTALQLIDDVVATAGSAALTKGNQVAGTDGTNARILSTNTSGHVNIADGGNSITVDGTVSITSNSAVNVAQINGVTPLMGNGSTGTGSLRVTLASDTTANTNAFLAVGNIAHDAVDSGNPMKAGAQARTTNPAAVADADRVNLIADDVGRLIVVNNQCRDLVASQNTTITASTSETTIVTAGSSGVFNDLTSLAITNSSSTSLIVTLKDSTAGTTRGIYAIAGNGGIVLTFATPKTQSGAAANWTLTCGSSVSSIYVVAEYVKNV